MRMPPPASGRGWSAGPSVDGFNLVPEWLREGFVSLSASQLGNVDPDASYDELKQAVETGLPAQVVRLPRAAA